jgi:DNA-directed RNA polymerase specialized sigma24 family protein
MARPERDGPDSFPTTNWAVVRQAADAAVPGRRLAQDELLRRYRPVLWAHLVYKKRVPADQADDLVQDFIRRKILEGNLLQLADPGQGRLRSYLLTALQHFCTDCQRRQARTPTAEELRPEEMAEAGPDRDEVIWAMQVVIEGLRRMRAECDSKRRPDLWGVFAARFLGPLRGVEPVEYQLLADGLGLDSAHQAANRYLTATAMFRRNLRAVLGEDGGADVEEQALDLGRIFSAASAELVEQLRSYLWNDVPEVTMSVSSDGPLDRAALSRLLEVPSVPTDRAALLRQVLAAPVPVDPGGCTVPGGVMPGPASVGALLFGPDPALEMLELAKDWAKDNRTDPESPLPPEVATLVYYACIAAALARCGRRITRHDDAILEQGFRWGLGQPWADEATRRLLDEGLRALGGREGPPD